MRRLLAGLVIFVGFSVPVLAADQTPAAFVQKVYDADSAAMANVDAGGGAAGPGDPVNDEGLRKHFFSKGLAHLITVDRDTQAKTGEEGRLDFDPVSDSDNPAVSNLSIETVSASAAKATVKVSFTGNQSEQIHLTYSLVKEGGQWRVDDIGPFGTEGSLRNLLKGE